MKEIKKYFLIILKNTIIPLLVLYCQHIQLVYSASVSIRYCLTMNIGLQILNLMIAAVPFFLILLVSGRTGLSLSISSILITLLSLINYHVYLYHGTPFMASDVYNVATAINVLPSYHVVFDTMVKRLLLVAAAEVVLIIVFCFVSFREKNRIVRKTAVAVLIADIAFLWFVFFSQWTLFPNSLVSWSWAKPMRKYGYETCLVNSVHTVMNKFTVMDGYDVSVIEAYLPQEEDAENVVPVDRQVKYPDIILILNETLSNLDYCANIPEGFEALEKIYSIPGIISGYSTVPLIGGGTNCSEYELLTSNSFYQISVASPFIAFDMSKSDSVVRYLKKLGYTTTGMHCYSEVNYSRDKAYPALGFDQVYLGERYFTHNRYGNREWLDKDNYKDMLELYKKADDSPLFMFMLTFQNHGGYEQNDSKMDTITVNSDFGQYTDDLNECLTSIQFSSEAFSYLISELSKSERPVIVLMTGDHAPSFISEIPAAASAIADASIIQRTVPYFVWSNIDLDFEVFTVNSTLTDLMPMLLKAADMPLSAYYELINNIRQVVPVRTSDGIYLDKDNNLVEYAENEPYYEVLRDYYYMEYNRVKCGEDYLEGLYSPLM